MEDLLEIIYFAIQQESLVGPINVVHPDIVTQKEFAIELGKAIHRPAKMPLPSFMVNLMFGQMGEEVLLADLNVEPAKLKQTGYNFKESTLADSLISMLSFN